MLLEPRGWGGAAPVCSFPYNSREVPCGVCAPARAVGFVWVKGLAPPGSCTRWGGVQLSVFPVLVPCLCFSSSPKEGRALCAVCLLLKA